MKASELKAKSLDEVKGEIKELRRAQFALRMQIATQQSNKVDQLRKLRRDIARAKTVITEKAK
ncbi:MAG: 50S ribosomal protein L29 [Sulfuricellaceae bacterium]|jgi:large subunit ribosomal protein L29